MQVRATRQGDVRIGRRVVALFPGQLYDLPEDVARAHAWLVPVETEDKAIDGPPRDKAVSGPSNTKGSRGAGR
jgi:hypothetical protein